VGINKMSSTNQSPFYQKAEAKFLASKTDEERLTYLEEMIRECPKHKSSEKMLAQLRTRYKKIKEKIEKNKKTGRGGKAGIKKEGVQAIFVGRENVGKSSMLNLLTEAKPKIAQYPFTTKKPIVGMMTYGGIEFQIIENPSFGSEYYDRGIVHTADIILLVVTNLSQISELKKELDRERGKQIILYNKSDTLNSNEKRKVSANLQSKKYNFILVSTKTKEGVEEIKEKLLENSGRIRVYTKEPGKEHSKKPVMLSPDSTVRNIAEKILKGFSDKVKETKIWGPSSKFPGQKVGLNHKLKDLDIVEFKTT
jgi:hypothetical protein